MADFIRARSDEQKEQRMTEIKEATERLFQSHPYHEITLASIAEELGWSRAALYKYVTTKEEIFLEICTDKRHAYNSALLTAYPATCTYSHAVLAEVWTEQLNNHREYFKYCDILMTILETNVSIERLAAFKKDYYDGQDELVQRFAQNLGMSTDRTHQLLNAVYYHAIGIGGWCADNPLVEEAVKLTGVTRRTVDFRDEMRDFITMCLEYYCR